MTLSASSTPLREWVRFLAVGILNTGLSYGLYLILALVLDYRVAYATAYIFGIVVSYIFNSRWVFRSGFSLRGFLMFPVVYVGQALVATVALQLVVDGLNVDTRVAPLIIAVVLTPLTYLLSKAALTR